MPFQPEWAVIYQSVFYPPSAIWLPADAQVVRRYTFVLGAVTPWRLSSSGSIRPLSTTGEVESRLYHWLVNGVDGDAAMLCPPSNAGDGTLAPCISMGTCEQ